MGYLFILRGGVTIPAHFSPGRLCLVLGFIILEQKLQRLKKYLSDLPSALAIETSFKSHYNLDNFELDAEWLEDVGIMILGAVNRQLRVEARLSEKLN